LFVLGSPGALSAAPTVAVVGTRRCTPEGLSVAYELGRDLAAAGVTVVSGLALGIDGAAHGGALAARRPLAAPTVGVAASGVDVVYPRRHRALWSEIGRWGAVVSETAPGSPAQAWRFPARNRIIAGLAQVVVVVESHLRGGSWHTVDAALEAGKEVAAFPGPVRSPASAGTNRLLATGAAVVTSADDVLDLLDAGSRTSGRRPAARLHPRPPEDPPLPDMGARARVSGSPMPRPQGCPPGPLPGRETPRPQDALASALLAALPRRPTCLDELVERSRLPVGAALVALDCLESAGLVAEDNGWWWRSG
jgi:DNA processing protein